MHEFPNSDPMNPRNINILILKEEEKLLPATERISNNYKTVMYHLRYNQSKKYLLQINFD